MYRDQLYAADYTHAMGDMHAKSMNATWRCVSKLKNMTNFSLIIIGSAFN